MGFILAHGSDASGVHPVSTCRVIPSTASYPLQGPILQQLERPDQEGKKGRPTDQWIRFAFPRSARRTGAILYDEPPVPTRNYRLALGSRVCVPKLALLPGPVRSHSPRRLSTLGMQHPTPFLSFSAPGEAATGATRQMMCHALGSVGIGSCRRCTE